MAEVKKIREEVARLFEMSLIPLAVRLGGGPIKSVEDENKDSYWYDYSSSAVNNNFFHMPQSDNFDDDNINEKIDSILSTWEVFSDKDKRLIKPLIEKIFWIQNKYKDKGVDIDETVSEYVYMMY